jgi:hypothetical protein
MSEKYTITEKDAKNVEIGTNGCEKEGITVMLDCIAADDKLKPFLIFHGSAEHEITDLNPSDKGKYVSVRVSSAIVK